MEGEYLNYEQEIKWRKLIMDKIHAGNRITTEERQWLVTHRIYNQVLGYPYLNADIVHMTPKILYSIHVAVESVAYPGKIIPVFTVPAGKGKIITDYTLTDHSGGQTTGKPVKMLGCLVDLNHKETQFYYQSHLGLFGVSFECEYFDKKQQLTIRKSSQTNDFNYAMLRDDLTHNKVLYRCKAPTEENFNSLVFSIEWTIRK